MEILPKIFSNSQLEFMKERSIVENVLVAQKIIRDINKRNKHHNVVVKLDIVKIYDRVHCKKKQRLATEFADGLYSVTI